MCTDTIIIIIPSRTLRAGLWPPPRAASRLTCLRSCHDCTVKPTFWIILCSFGSLFSVIRTFSDIWLSVAMPTACQGRFTVPIIVGHCFHVGKCHFPCVSAGLFGCEPTGLRLQPSRPWMTCSAPSNWASTWTSSAVTVSGIMAGHR